MSNTEVQIQLAPEVTPEDPSYIEQMAAKGEQAVARGNGNPASIPAKPEGIPDKFYNAMTGEVDYAGLAKSYTELEKKFSQPKPKTEEPAPEVKPEPKAEADPAAENTPAEEGSEAAAEALQSVGLNLQEFNTEYAEQGTLSEASYEKLAKVGIDKATVDGYIAGQLAVRELARQTAFAQVGGESEYTAMSKWAATNVSKAELAAYNEAVESGDQAKVNLAVRGMHDRFVQANGREPGTQIGGSNAVPGIKPFGSRAEMTAAMADPKYAKDPAYQNEVIRRIEVSTIF